MMGEGAYQSDFNSPELVNPGAEQVWAVLHGIDDPCMCLAGKGLSIVDMGIVTKVEVRDDRATIELVFTDPSCLFELRIVGAIEERLARLDGLADFQVQIACQPIWTTDRLSPKASASFASDREKLRAGRSSSAPPTI
jgi:metal-sulfur cluster biosynthetic enzyme